MLKALAPNLTHSLTFHRPTKDLRALFFDTLNACLRPTYGSMTCPASTDPPQEREPPVAKILEVKYENQAQARICEVAYESQADLCWHEVTYDTQASGDTAWFFVTRENQASFKVFKVKYETQADLKVFKVKYPEQAGWRNPAHTLKGKLG